VPATEGHRGASVMDRNMKNVLKLLGTEDIDAYIGLLVLGAREIERDTGNHTVMRGGDGICIACGKKVA